MIAPASNARLTRALLIPLVVLAWLTVLIIAGWLLGHVLRALLILILAIVISFAVTPIVGFLSRWVPRAAAISVAYVLVLAILLGFVGLLVATAAAQITDLAHNLPSYSKGLGDYEPRLVQVLSPFGVTAAQVHSYQANLVTGLQGFGARAARDALDVVALVVNTVIDGVLVLMLSIYVTANGPRIRQWLREQAPPSQKRRTNLLIAIVNHVVGGYVRGQLTLAAIVGVLVTIGMLIFHVPYAVLLGVIAFFMEFIPILGVFISGAVCVVAALTQGPAIAALVVLWFVGVHVIEGDLLGPRIVGKAVGIHPAIALLALVAGTELFGFWGALLGAPLAGLIQATATTAWLEIRHGETPRVIEDVVKTDVSEAQQESRRLDEEGQRESPEERAIERVAQDDSAGESPGERVVNRLRGKKRQPKKPAASAASRRN